MMSTNAVDRVRTAAIRAFSGQRAALHGLVRGHRPQARALAERERAFGILDKNYRAS
jgi:hypothetical protein